MSRLLAAQPDPAAVEALLAKEAIPSALLLELQFASVTARISDWQGYVVDGNGVTWAGLGELVGISDLEGGSDNLAPLREYILGIPWELLDKESTPTQIQSRIPALIGAPSEYRGRSANLSFQLFDPDLTDQFGRPLPVGVPVALDAGLMTNVSWSLAPGAGGVITTLRVEGVLARKGSPQYGLLTDRDQKRRYGDDEGLEFVPEVMSTNVNWTDW
ncbi:hypothetical protein [Defluviimonas sp. SAOS-178_SWC]|uniref:hypothetical protein n=1 Tax=Defluviimonas sp. SAOS-178_SWC TaxID=3121287 RepID=UPI003221DD3C